MSLVLVVALGCSGGPPKGGAPPAPPAVQLPPPTPLQFQHTRLTPPPGATVQAHDASGLELVLGGEGSRCGPHTARLEYVARDGPIPPPDAHFSGTRCEDHVLVHHTEARPAILARLTCTVRGELEGRTPATCAALAATLVSVEDAVIPPPASGWSVRPALDRTDHPTAVEYFQPGARVWFRAASHRTLDLMPGVTAQVLVNDVHHSGENTVILAQVGDAPEAVVFEDYVLGLEPAGPATGPTPVDLHVTVKHEPEPMRAEARCSVWRFEGVGYRDSGEGCG